MFQVFVEHLDRQFNQRVCEMDIVQDHTAVVSILGELICGGIVVME